MSITQADNECRLEGDKTHEIFHFLSKKVGGDISYVVPTKLKSGGARPPPPRPPPIYARASCPLYVTLHIVSSRQLVILPIPKCVLHATQYAFVALWLLARIPGNVLAHSLSVLAFLVRYPIRHVHNAIFANRPKPRCRAHAKITNWEDNQLSGRRVVSPTCRA